MHFPLVLLVFLEYILAKCSGFRFSPTIFRRKSCVLNMAQLFDFKGLKSKTEEKMTRTINALQNSYNALRVNSLTPSLLENIMVSGIDSASRPLFTVAVVRPLSQSSLSVEVFDVKNLKHVEIALQEAALGLQMVPDDIGALKVSSPPPTEARRKEMVKKAKSIAEDSKVSLRNIRRDAVETVKSQEKVKQIDKDDSKYFQSELQKLTDRMTESIDKEYKLKEKSLSTLG